jgi:two-component system LytT family sensor kinase
MRQINSLLSWALQHRLGRHILFWITIYLVFTIAQSNFVSKSQDTFTIILLNIPGMLPPIIAAYFLNYYLIPKFFNRQKLILFLFLFVLSGYFICVLARIINVHIAEPLYVEGSFEQESISEILVQLPHLFTVYFPEIYLIAFAMTVLKQQKSHFEMKQRNILLEKERARSELNFLKAQIHPHFLFNTLNNLYVLSLKKSDKAPETVIKLSEILDYILYQGDDDVVPVEKEVKLLSNYIGLEQLRYGNQLKVSFIKNIEKASVKVSPLLLLPIVENAFKHGASGSLDAPLIEIELNVKDQQLFFKVFNSKNLFSKAGKINNKSGIGVSNIKRQLALTYREYNFVIQENKEDYLATLFINLESRIKKFENAPSQKQKIMSEFPELFSV